MPIKTVKNSNGEPVKLYLEQHENIVGNVEDIIDWKNSLENILNLNDIAFSVSNQYGATGAWCSHNPDSREIGVGSFWYDNENMAPVISVLHEIGHWYDETTNFDVAINYFQSLGTLELETRAWEYAIDFGVLIGFDNWEGFKKFALFCLGTYFKDNWGNVYLRDSMRGFRGTPPTWQEAVERIEKKLSQAQLGLVGLVRKEEMT